MKEWDNPDDLCEAEGRTIARIDCNEDHGIAILFTDGSGLSIHCQDVQWKFFQRRELA